MLKRQIRTTYIMIKLLHTGHKYIRNLIGMQIFRSQLVSSCYKLYESVRIISPDKTATTSCTSRLTPRIGMSVEDPKKDADRKITIWPQWLATCTREYFNISSEIKRLYVALFLNRINNRAPIELSITVNQLFLNRCLIPIKNLICIEL